jgi:hypothetical protein
MRSNSTLAVWLKARALQQQQHHTAALKKEKKYQKTRFFSFFSPSTRHQQNKNAEQHRTSLSDRKLAGPDSLSPALLETNRATISHV